MMSEVGSVVTALNSVRKRYRTDVLNRLAHGSLFLVGQGWATRIVHNWVFEAVVSVLIVMNTMLMAAEVQFEGSRLGHSLGHSRYGAAPDELLPWATLTFDVLFLLFTTLFFSEFLLRCIDLRAKVFLRGWMWFDAFILSMSIVDILSRFNAAAHGFDMNPSSMRMARLCRMLRVMKVLKRREGFAALFLLIKSIQASTHALFWSCSLMLFVMLIAGLMINQLLLGYLTDGSIPESERLEVFNLFGTYTRMFVTMFEFTLGNWAPPQRVLMQNVAEWWGIFVVTYRAVLCFALVNISAAVFNSETSKTASADDEVVMMNRERTARHQLRKLEALFKELDKTGDGRITYDEFQELVHDQVMKQFLFTLHVDFEDARELFRLLDDGDGTVVREDFIRGMKAMGGEAKSLDVIILMKMARNMDAKLDKMLCP